MLSISFNFACQLWCQYKFVIESHLFQSWKCYKLLRVNVIFSWISILFNLETVKKSFSWQMFLTLTKSNKSLFFNQTNSFVNQQFGVKSLVTFTFLGTHCYNQNVRVIDSIEIFFLKVIAASKLMVFDKLKTLWKQKFVT
jgi:hypothetical protein